MSDLSAADRAALRELLGGIHPDLLPLAVDQARSDFWTRYFVADANGLEFATVRNDDDVTADLIVRALNALPALLDAAEKVAEPEGATGFKVTPILRANASIEAIELDLADQRRVKARQDRVVAQLEELAVERRAQIAAGTWPPKTEPEEADRG